MSPVFGTPEELARGLAEHKVPAFSGYELTYDGWLEFILELNEPLTYIIKSDLDQHLDRADEFTLKFIDQLFSPPLVSGA